MPRLPDSWKDFFLGGAPKFLQIVRDSVLLATSAVLLRLLLNVITTILSSAINIAVTVTTTITMAITNTITIAVIWLCHSMSYYGMRWHATLC